MSVVWHRNVEGTVVYLRQTGENEWIVGTIGAEIFDGGGLSPDEMACWSLEEAVDLVADQCAREAHGRLDEDYLEEILGQLREHLGVR